MTYMTITEKLCECGCGKTTRLAEKTDPRTGAAEGQPRRFVKGHARTTRPEDRWNVDPVTGCWVWNRKLGPAGYGTTKDRGPGARTITAHRWSWELHRGPISGGLHIDHLCRNRACVNPDHLELVTPRENVLRGGSTKLSEADVERAWVMHAQGASYAAIGRAFSVTGTTVRLRLMAMQNARLTRMSATPPPVRRSVNLSEIRKPVGQRGKTHCPSDHEYSPENTRVTKLGHRQCIACDVAKQRARRGVTELSRPRLTAEIREKIVKFAEWGRTQAQIAAECGVSQAAVSRTLKLAREAG